MGRFQNQIIRAPPWPETLRPTARPHMIRVKELSAIFTTKSGDENRKIDFFGKIRPTTLTTLYDKGSGRKGSNATKAIGPIRRVLQWNLLWGKKLNENILYKVYILCQFAFGLWSKTRFFFSSILGGRVKIHIIFKRFWYKKKLLTITAETIHFVSEIIFEDLVGT